MCGLNVAGFESRSSQSLKGWLKFVWCRKYSKEKGKKPHFTFVVALWWWGNWKTIPLSNV